MNEPDGGVTPREFFSLRERVSLLETKLETIHEDLTGIRGQLKWLTRIAVTMLLGLTADLLVRVTGG